MYIYMVQFLTMPPTFYETFVVCVLYWLPILNISIKISQKDLLLLPVLRIFINFSSSQSVPNIIFSQDILVQRSQCTVGGIAVSALPDQSCPKNKDKWIQNQKQTHLSLWKTFQWHVWSSRNTTQISAIKLKLFRDQRQRTPFHLSKNTRSKNLHYNLETALTTIHLTFKGLRMYFIFIYI